MRILTILLSFAVLLSACTKEEAASPVATQFPGFKQPSTFPNPIYKFENNAVTEARFVLGKKLFYDGRLSRDGSISCASCHLQYSAFAHFDHPVSHGIDDQLGTRNSPTLQNLAWSPFFFWDGGVFDLDLFSLAPIHNPIEMDEEIGNVLLKLKADAKYPALFKAAYNTDSMNSTQILQALSSFMNMLVSANSRYDKYIAGDVSVMNADEVEGMNIFMQNCNSCHTAPLFSDQQFHSNGIQRTGDRGRGMITLQGSDNYKFKTPTLRNVDKSMPYMHDGRFVTLEQVMGHYVSNIPNANNVDANLIGGISLNADEQAKVIAFLKTLTDDEFLRNPLFSEE